VRRLLVALWFAGCGCGSSTPPAARTVENRVPDAGVVANDDSCPEAWDRAVGAIACDPARATRICTFDEGTCYCGIEPWCGGMAPDPEWQRNQPTTWQCSAKPPEVRADGCPGVPPEGGACAQDGQQCGYGDCCVSTYQCIGGQWRAGPASCPP